MNSENKTYDSRILIIDDEIINVELLEDILDGSGYEQVTGVTDPKEGIDLYKQQEFDLILLDINMPELSGFDVMEILKTIEKGLPPPILVLTALKNQNICNFPYF